MKYPKWVRVRQTLDGKKVENPAKSVQDQLISIQESISFKPGQRIAVTVGSRYISNLPDITRAVIDFLKSKKACPFLIPSMGSHGGATSQGQRNILEEFGFSEQSMGVPTLSSMEVVLLGEIKGIPIYFDKNAYESDGIVVINRVKPHQVFKGDIQSGLNKMMALGLGKGKGADAIHKSGRNDILGEIGNFIRSHTPILFGIAILDNSYGETRDISVITPDRFIDIDKEWAKASRGLLPRIPVRELDMVLVDEMGKDISGSGMDTNVIGFTRRPDHSGQPASLLAVFDLTEKSDGNAIGIGLADFTTRKLVDKIDFTKTNRNVIATGVYSAGRIPICLNSEREILDVILQKIEDPESARIIKIKNTLHLEEFFATEEIIPLLKGKEGLLPEGNPFETFFDDSGNIVWPSSESRKSK